MHNHLIEAEHGEKCNYAGEMGIQATDAVIGHLNDHLVLKPELSSQFSFLRMM